MSDSMSPSEEVEIKYEDSRDADLQIVQLEDGQTLEDYEKPKETAPSGVTLTKDQYDELVRGKDSTSTLSSSFQALADKLTPRNSQQVQAPLPELDMQQLEEEAYKPGQWAKAVKTVTEQTIAKVNAQNVPLMQQQSKMLLKLDPSTGEYFKRYEKDIEAKKQMLPPQYQILPNVYNLIYDEVMKEKQSEIIEDKAKAMAMEIAKQLQNPGQTKAQPGMFTEGVKGVSGVSQPKKTTLVLTTYQRDDMLADGMNPGDVDQVRSYLKNWKEKGRK